MFKLIICSILLICCSSVFADGDPVRTEAIEHIRNYMNTSVDPCDNFFQYACGNWKNSHTIPDDKQIINGHLILGNQILTEIKTLLEQDTPLFDAEVELKVKQFYKSCLNTDLITKKSFEPIKKLLKTLGGMPLLEKDEWDETKFSCIKLESTLHTYGFEGLLRINVLDSKSSNVGGDIYIGEIDLPLTKKEHESETKIDEYKQKIVKIFVEKLGVNIVDADKVAAEIVEFEKKLVKGFADDAIRADDSKYLVHTKVEELKTKYPTVEWENFLTESFNVPIEGSRAITEISPEYINNLANLIKDTPKSVIGNFMMWNVIRQFIKVTGQEEQIPERVSYCIGKTKEYFPKEIGLMYSNKYYDNEIKDDIVSMVDLIKKEIHTAFEKFDWIDDDTKNLAYKRLYDLKVDFIGTPKGTKVNIEPDFNKIDVNAEEYFTNIINILQYNHKNYVKKTLTNSKTDEFIDSTGIQAYYSIKDNTLKIALGFLKPPFYTKTLPRNMKFAQIGAVLVHEITHGFDSIGQRIDLQGMLKNWWSEKSTEAFNNKLKCFANQYGPHQTAANPDVSDNVADNGGIKYAFLTYSKWANDIKDTKKDLYELETFPGLDFTNTQLFFITHAQTWCHVAKGNTPNELIYPVEYRINIPMTNFDEFSKQFKCPEGSLMNPKDKCLLW